MSNFLLICGITIMATVLASGQDFLYPTTRQVPVFVNVYDHPKTGFSCAGKIAGEYYADPATKCAVYYVCIPNPTGTMSPQSFACPNGTLFSQATRVCKPHYEVFCPLASRFYDSVHGSIDTRAEAPPPGEPLIVPKQLPPQPAPQPQSQPRPRSHSKPAPAPAPVPQPVQGPSPPPQRARGFRNSRVFGVTQPSTTTTTTTTTTTARPAAPGPLPDYEYDYADYNDTVLATAASSIQMETVQKISDQLNVEKEAATVEGASPAKIAEEKIVSRQKRESDLWMLSRRKGQLNETVSLFPVSSFTCEDKITGVAYADIVSGCRKFFVCISVAKGKLLAYHLDCDKEKRFNQILGMCDSKTETKTCDHSERYYIYNKWYRASKRHLLDISKKQQS